MKPFLEFLARHKKAIIVSLVLLITGACFRWEIREVDNARTNQPITRYQGIVFPWMPCGANGGGTPITFMSATGSATASSNSRPQVQRVCMKGP